MTWRKRRKRPRLSSWAYIGIACGTLFVFGNLLLLHDDFQQLYSDAFRSSDAITVGAGNGEAGKKQNGGYMDRTLRRQMIELPEAAIAMETHVRKLMQERSSGGAYDDDNALLLRERQYSTQIDDTANLRYRPSISKDFEETRSKHNHDVNVEQDRDSQIVGDERNRFRSKNPVNVVRIPPDELRRTLWKTSDCEAVRNVTSRQFVASGWTKAVFKGLLTETRRRRRRYTMDDSDVNDINVDTQRQGDTKDIVAREGKRYMSVQDQRRQREVKDVVQRHVAVKVIDQKGHDVMHCVDQLGLDEIECYNRAVHKMLKEIVLLRGMQHPHVVQVLSHCVPEEEYRGAVEGLVSMTVELGTGIDLIGLLQMAWEDRLRICFGLAKLLAYLSSSPFGSVVLNDFQRQQFVLVDGEIKMTDVDDMGFQEPRCRRDEDCEQYFSAANHTLRTPCIDGECRGMNDKRNVFNVARHFTTFLLSPGAPKTLAHDIKEVAREFQDASLPSIRLLPKLSRLVDLYVSGAYLQRTEDQYESVYTMRKESDMAGVHDYNCRYNLGGGDGCTVSVFDVREAEELCDREPQCQAFVLSSQKTWTGRLLAHLKNGVSSPSLNMNTTLYIKPIDL